MNAICRKLFLLSTTSLALTTLSAQTQNAPAATAPASEPAPAVTSSPETDKFTIRLGAFLLSDIKTTLSLSDSNGNPGDSVDFEKSLGGDDSVNVFRLDGDWRFATNHKVQLAVFDISRSASRTLSAEINWGDQVYPVAATINTNFDTLVYKVNYGYTFYRTPKHEVSALAGLHITQFKTSIGLANVPGSLESVSATAPLPVFGLEWKAQLSAKLTTHVSYTYFGLSVDDKYSGNLSDFQALIDYRLNRHWAVGAGYNRFVLRATYEGPRNRDLTIKHNYNGLMVFVTANF